MGTDNLFHKRKARQNREIKRQKAKIEPYARVLIVCEDSKSVPAYLEAVCDNLKLSNSNIKICGKECGSAPINVVEFAIKQKSGYDKTYCVIDRDQHSKFHEALQKAQGKKIEVIISIPCFEYWLLLHFEYVSRPFRAAQGSDCNEVIKVLKKNLPNYEKDAHFFREDYSKLKEKQAIAINNAKKRVQACQHDELENRNPYTEMHLLIEYLTHLKSVENRS